MPGMKRFALSLLLTVAFLTASHVAAAARDEAFARLKPYFAPRAEFAGKRGTYRSPLLFDDGTRVKDAADWPRRREEILHKWHTLMGRWPALLERPGFEIIERTPKPDHVRL